MKKKPKEPKLPTGSKRTPSSKANITSTEDHWKWIRTEKPFQLPDYVREAMNRLAESGHIAYIVGGSVRDFLLGRPIKDHDIATSADPDELCRIFPDAVTVGKAFGVLKIPIPGQKYPLEIATFRKDLEYKDHRHPESVEFAGPGEDAERRDFTINALFYDPKSGKILDTVGGIEDLKQGVVRAIGDPQERFREDALRLLRAVRFSCSLGFPIEEKTLGALKARAKLIQKISAERIRDELTQMWAGPRAADALKTLDELGLVKLVLPEITPIRKSTYKILEKLAQHAPSRAETLAWASILHELGHPVTAGQQAHPAAGAVAARMRLSSEESQRIQWLVEEHTKFRDVFQMREATLQRFVRQLGFDQLLALHRAEAIATDGNLIFYEFCLGRYEESLKQPEANKLIKGEDLVQLGLQPGPRFSQILRTVEDLALEGKIRSKDEALEYVIRHFS